jgi:hypothetical protein
VQRAAGRASVGVAREAAGAVRIQPRERVQSGLDARDPLERTVDALDRGGRQARASFS